MRITKPKKKLTERLKRRLRRMSRPEVVAMVVKSFDDQIVETSEGIRQIEFWMELNPHEPPIDLERMRVSLAKLRWQRARFIEINANAGPDDKILMPE